MAVEEEKEERGKCLSDGMENDGNLDRRKRRARGEGACLSCLSGKKQTQRSIRR